MNVLHWHSQGCVGLEDNNLIEGKKALKKQKGQRKQSHKRAKRKAVLASRKNDQSITLRSPLNQARSISSTFGINYCLVTENLFELGIGYVVLGRTMSSTMVATALFLVDVHCLGVKNAFFSKRTHSELRLFIDTLSADGNTMVDISPECAKKIIDGAVAYAKKFNFSPHADYPPAYALFGDTNTDACPIEYEFGKDGKPFFVSGPNDTPAKIRKAIRSLTETAGAGNFDYIVEAGPPHESHLGSDY